MLQKHKWFPVMKEIRILRTLIRWCRCNVAIISWNICSVLSNRKQIFGHARYRLLGFINVSWVLQNNLAKTYIARNYIYAANVNLKLCPCAQIMALGTRTKFQIEILIRSTISAIHKFRENILESSRNVSEKPCFLRFIALCTTYLLGRRCFDFGRYLKYRIFICMPKATIPRRCITALRSQEVTNYTVMK